MRWLVVGYKGMLGQDLVKTLTTKGLDVSGVDRTEVDITNAQDTFRALAGYDVVVNCAAYTAVDAAEDAEELAFQVNGLGASNLARATKIHGSRLIHISTDYVFSGDATVPYVESDVPGPASAYGRTKLAGEWAVEANTDDYVIVRTAWLYGANGNCFPKTIVKLLNDRDAITVVDDQFGQPTWTVDLAELIFNLVDTKVPSGIYHGTSGGQTNWFEFARTVAVSAGLDPERVQPTTSAEFKRPAPRPAWSVLEPKAVVAAGVTPIQSWQDAWENSAAEILA